MCDEPYPDLALNSAAVCSVDIDCDAAGSQCDPRLFQPKKSAGAATRQEVCAHEQPVFSPLARRAKALRVVSISFTDAERPDLQLAKRAL